MPDIGGIDISLVDAANPVIFLRAMDLGLKGKEIGKESRPIEDTLFTEGGGPGFCITIKKEVWIMWKVGVDIGGTFTDVVIVNEETGELLVTKYPTTTKDPSMGFTRGLEALFSRSKINFGDVSQIVHASTLATNTLLERKKQGDTALITTKGFRDVLEIQRQRRYDLYDIFIEKPKPVIPRHDIWEIEERIAYDGTIIKAMNEEEVRTIVTECVQRHIRSIVISLLHSYANPSHEKRIGEIIREAAPDIMISLSHEVVPHIGEYERTNTAAINAYVMPETGIYLEKLVRSLRNMGYSEDLYIFKSNGGITTVDDMVRFPVHMIEAGPAAGALMAAFHGNHTIDSQNLVSLDMGGTTAKLSLIENARPRITDWFEADKVKLKEGSGLPIIVPAVDLIEIGAGGGSIASVKMGIIAVGPESAGAEPGPACYGSGGKEPTVTDANLVLGYLDPGYFLGGSIKLDKGVAYRSIQEKIAKPLGLDVPRAAWGIHDIVNRNMTAATRVVSVERGKDPRMLSLVVFGGAGPAHGSRIAKELAISRVFIPFGAGVTSAMGLLVAGLSFDFSGPTMALLAPEILQSANRIFQELKVRGEAMLKKARAKGDYAFLRTADMRYFGQGEHFNVSIPDGSLDDRDLEEIKRRFNEKYDAMFGYKDESQKIEVVNWRLTAYCPPPPIKLKKFKKRDETLRDAIKGKREVFFPETHGFVDCMVYDRYRLFDGAVIEGPAVIEERESTALILPGDRARVDAYGNLMVEIEKH